MALRVVLFTYYFPPAPDVGALRARKIADSFLRHGATVDVVSAPLQRGSDSATVPPGLTVHRLAPSLDLRALYRRLRRRAADEVLNTNGSADAKPWAPPEHQSFLKRQISAALWLPDDRQGWILPAANLGTRLVRRGANLIYSTAPPFSVHLAALLVKQRTRVPWVVELRDPWTDNPWKPDFVRSRWSDAADRWLERSSLRRADMIVAVTDSVAELLRHRVPTRARSKVVVILNGIDALAPESSSRNGPVRRITYAGNLYQERDPRPFLTAIATLARKRTLPEPMRIDFIGDCRWFAGASMEEFVRANGLSDIVHFVEPMPHAECMRRLHDSDLLLLLAQNQPLQVPNKLYEYLGTRRPILAFVDAEGESTRMLRQVGGHYVVDRLDPEFVAEMVGNAITGEPVQKPASADGLLHEWTAEVQFDRLQQRLGSLRQ